MHKNHGKNHPYFMNLRTLFLCFDPELKLSSKHRQLTGRKEKFANQLSPALI
jgi:hypothetical protein